MASLVEVAGNLPCQMQGKAIGGKVSPQGRSYKTSGDRCPGEAAGHGGLMARASQEPVLTKPSSVQKLVLLRPPGLWEPGPREAVQAAGSRENSPEAESKP